MVVAGRIGKGYLNKFDSGEVGGNKIRQKATFKLNMVPAYLVTHVIDQG